MIVDAISTVPSEGKVALVATIVALVSGKVAFAEGSVTLVALVDTKVALAESKVALVALVEIKAVCISDKVASKGARVALAESVKALVDNKVVLSSTPYPCTIYSQIIIEFIIKGDVCDL